MDSLKQNQIGGVLNFQHRPMIGERIHANVFNLSGTRLVDSLQSKTKPGLEVYITSNNDQRLERGSLPFAVSCMVIEWVSLLAYPGTDTNLSIIGNLLNVIFTFQRFTEICPWVCICKAVFLGFFCSKANISAHT